MWRSLAEVQRPHGGSIVVVGNFDGVHRGHQQLLTRAADLSRVTGWTTIAVTFDPHPVAVLAPDRAPQPLTTMPERAALLRRYGAHEVLAMPFTTEVAQWASRRFVDTVLREHLNARQVIVGRDFTYGHFGAGNTATLLDECADFGCAVAVVDDVASPDVTSRRWSSSWVREALADGDPQLAKYILGRPYTITGPVVHGDHRGRELGFPTANVAAQTMLPADGVYAGWLTDLGAPAVAPWPTAIHVGTNATFDGHERRCEAHAIDLTDIDLYGKQVRLEFVERVRPTRRFDSVDDLVEAIQLDVARCRAILGADQSRS